MQRVIELGQIVGTPGVLRAVMFWEIMDAIDRHARGDWGDVCQEDKQANDEAAGNGARVLSAYATKSGTKFWIITEADRSTTTVLLPEEY